LVHFIMLQSGVLHPCPSGISSPRVTVVTQPSSSSSSPPSTTSAEVGPFVGSSCMFFVTRGYGAGWFRFCTFSCPWDCVSRKSHTFETGDSPLEPRTLDNRNLPFLLQSPAMTSTAAALHRLSSWEVWPPSRLRGTRSPPRGFRFYIGGVFHHVTRPVFPVGSRHLVPNAGKGLFVEEHLK
jgi:hypothetical protein